MNYVFSFGLIPVQEFITEATRSRDLRSGSALLSWLMKEALRAIKERLDIKILIPSKKLYSEIATKTLKDILMNATYSLPNRASGYCEAQDDRKIQKVFNKIAEETLNEIWKSHVIEHLKFENIFDPIKDTSVKNHMQQYIESADLGVITIPIQMVWVALPTESSSIDEANSNVRKHLSDIHKFYDNVKRTRSIKSWRLPAPIGKCTQCGKREAIGPKKSFNEWRRWYRVISNAPSVKAGYRFDSSETLCGVCLFKRLLSYAVDRKFPSTNEIASRYWMKYLKSEKNIKATLEESIQSVKKFLDIEWPLFFFKKEKKNINNILIFKYPTDHEKKWTELLDMRQRLSELTEGANRLDEPPGYLAVLVYDGDSMGKHVQENYDKVPERLIQFANSVAHIAEENEAEPFYLGGDEGIMLSSLESSISLACGIQQAFHSIFEKIDTLMTLSCGMVLFERSRPLKPAIEQAFALLRKAKRMSGKNALGVGVQTASGNIWDFTAHWGEAWNRVMNMLAKIRSGELSRSWLYEVEEFVRGLNDDLMKHIGMDKAVLAEIKRITWRKFYPLSGQEDKKDKVFKDFWSIKLNGDKWLDDFSHIEGLSEWANQFHLIAFLSRFLSEYSI